MRYLVTGGCGFIGTHLCRALLAQHHEVTVIDDLSRGDRANLPNGVAFINGSVTDVELLKTTMAKMDGCFHLAAIASVEQCRLEWLASHRVNLGGTVSVLDASANTAHKPPVVFASSAAIYGDPAELPISESTQARPISGYGLDKFHGEHYGRLAYEQYGVPNIGLRLFNVYGPGQPDHSPYSGVVTKFLQRIERGEALTVFGDGEQTRDFIFIADIVRLFLNAMANCNGHRVVNGCTGQARSLNQLVSACETLVGRSIACNHADAKQGDIRFSCGDPAGAKTLLGFTANTDFLEGLKATMADRGMKLAA